ncbi:MAG: tetratricopeptide repeat protein [Spongiibacteraceae bacterium]|jgi:tetratricopeptide (TPR) repeat protein|nr:tetratricopeptide repeat protein [Spongiibacteraceae bacterium]
MRRLLSLAILGSALLTGCQTLDRPAETQPAAAPAQPSREAQAAPAPSPAATTRPFPSDTFYDLLVAEVALRRGAYELSLDNYLQQARRTRDPQVTARAARLAQFLRADRAAAEIAALWVELQPDDLEANFTHAMQLAKQERPLDAMPYMVKVLEGGAQANFAAIAASATQQSEADQAQLLAQLRALQARYPDNAELLTGQALLLQQQGQRDQALELVRAVLRDNPTATHALLIETRLLQDMGREQEAFARLEQVVTQNPYNRRLRLQYARLLTNQDLEQARQQFEILVQQSPFDADLLLSLALISRETGALEEARRHFEQLLEMGERVGEAHYYLGQLAEQREDLPTALTHYQQIPPGSEFLPGVARAIEILLADEGLDGVNRFLDQVREQHQQTAVQLYLVESELLMDRQQIQSGQELLTEALQQFPDQPNLLYARSLFSEKLRDLPALESDLRKILERDPDNVHALNALGYSLANLTDRIDEAYELVRRAHELKPDDPAILDSMGWAEYRRGNLEVALDYLQRAYAAFPDAEVAAHLGKVMWELGRQQEAVELWLSALKKDPESLLIRDLLHEHRLSDDS